MESIWKTILGVLVAVLITLAGSAILHANNDAINAQNFLYGAANQYSASNFSETVLAECSRQAAEFGYTLSETEKITDICNTTQYVVLELTYTYRIPVLGVNREHSKTVVVH